MTVFISVVSHGHAEIIKKLDCLASLATIFKVVIKCNKSGDAELLSEYENCHTFIFSMKHMAWGLVKIIITYSTIV